MRELVENEYGLSVNITESGEESRYYVVLGTVDEREVSEAIGDIQATFDENLMESDWEVV